MSLNRFVVLMCFGLMLQACSLSGEAPPADHFYRLPEPSGELSGAQVHFDHVLIKPLQVSGLYHERAMLYVDAQRPLELHRYHYHFWTDPPDVLVQRYMKAWLLQHKVADRVSLDSVDRGEAEPALVISASLVGFEQRRGGAETDVRLAMDIRWNDADGNSHSTRIELKQAAASAGLYDAAEAFGQALDRLMKQLLDTISQKSA